MPAAKTIPAFYNTSDPYIIPVLSSQVEMFYQPADFIAVSTTEEMCIKSKPHPPHSTPLASGRASSIQPKTSSSLRQITQSPPPQVHAKMGAFSVPRSTSERLESPPSLLSPSPSMCSLTSLESDSGKIPKPNGEVGRSGRGGYNLEHKLKWGEAGFKTLQVR
jgi:hypothetical protein